MFGGLRAACRVLILSRMNDEEFAELVTRLEKEVTREGALVKLEQYGGGPDESRIIANCSGYMRLGIEFLKAAIAPYSDKTGKQPFDIEVDLEYLLSEDSDVGFDWFQRGENLVEVVEHQKKAYRWQGIKDFGCLALCLAVLSFAVIGAIHLAAIGVQVFISWLK